MKGVVKDVQPGKLVLSDGSEVPYGLLVWSTGVGPSEFVNSLELPKSSDGRCVHLFNLFFVINIIVKYLNRKGFDLCFLCCKRGLLEMA